MTRKLFRTQLWLVLPGLAFLLIFFAVPVARLLGLSVQDNASGSLTSVHYARIVASPVYVHVLATTFKISATTALLSVVLGYPLAYWLAQLVEVSRRRLIILVMVPFWTSYLVKTFAWMIILGQTGLINRTVTSIGLQPLPLLNNEFAVIVGMVHAMLPLAVLTMLPVMVDIDRRLGAAAGTLGAKPGQTFWYIYFPLSMPGVAAAGLLTFISSLGFFIVPALLGGRKEVMLAQLVIAQVQEMLNWSFAGALAVMMLVSALVICWIYDLLFGLSTLAGESSSEKPGKGLARGFGLWLIRCVAGLTERVASFLGSALRASATKRVLPTYSAIVILFLVVPSLLVIPIAFTSSQFLEFPPPGYSFRWFSTYLESDVWLSATLRSFGIALATGALATGLGGLAALAIARSKTRWRGLIFAAFLAPMIVPRVVIAVGLFYLFAQIGLVGTDLGLVIGHTVLALPFAFVAISAVLKSYDWRLNQAAASLGASLPKALRLITAPIISGGMVAAFLFAFITSFDELSVAIFISGGAKTTLPKQMWDDMILQLNPTLAAVSAIVLLIVTSILVAANRLRRSP